MNHVLILDDDELFARMLTDRLEKQSDLNVIITSTTTLEQAKEIAVETPGLYDVFLIDERLGPGPDGIDAIAIFCDVTILMPM